MRSTSGEHRYTNDPNDPAGARVGGVSGKKGNALRRVSRILRWTILFSLLAFVLSASVLRMLGYAAPSIHAICPYGGLESMLSIATAGTFIKKIFLGTFILFIVTMGLAVIMRRSFCGQLCAFGGLQEFFGKIGRKLFKKRPVLPRKLDRVLRYLKFVVLAVTIFMAWTTARLWISPYDPFGALGHIADFNALLSTYLIGFIVLLVTLFGSIVYDRFFCKYLCPVGALYGLIGKISPYAVRVNRDKCIQCGLCNQACPMNVDVMHSKNGKVTDIECINCNECVHACPKKGALSTGFGRKAALRPILATILTLAVFFTPLIIASANGSMQLLSNKYYKQDTAYEAAAEGAATGGISPDDISGSMTIEEISRTFDIPLDTLYAALELPNDFPAGTTIKSAAASLGASPGTLKHAICE